VRSASEFLYSLEKLRYLCNGMTDLHKIRHDEAKCVSQVCRPLKHLILKIQDSRQAICLTPFLHHHVILQFVDFQDDSCLPSLNFEILTANHFRDTFCIISLNFVDIGQTVAQISHFCIFQVKCKNSLDDRA